jgi:hypothetical protein
MYFGVCFTIGLSPINRFETHAPARVPFEAGHTSTFRQRVLSWWACQLMARHGADDVRASTKKPAPRACARAGD